MGAVISLCCPPHAEDDGEPPPVALAKVRMGKRGSQVRINESEAGALVSGEGGALADTVIEQDAAYWEVVVNAIGGACQVGVAYDRTGPLLDAQLGDGQSSWAVGPGIVDLKQDDVIGVAFGQGDIPNLRFFHNGTMIEESTVTRVRGEVHPAVSVGGGTELLLVFEPGGFAHTPPGRHTEVRPPRKMM
mmetsp:Transcript_46314/g.104085  ORF Transcript_46314/g.104085 Transcript_46314/m.104085 type:complete len:189 (-) Transcript_46314:156-722(-)